MSNPVSTLSVDNTVWRRLNAQLRAAQNMSVLVGIQSGTVTRSQTRQGRRKPAGLNMAQIGRANEFGTNRIPARPFVRPAINDNRTVLNSILSHQFSLICQGRQTTRRALASVGRVAQGLIVRQINSVLFPVLAVSTIRAKRSTKPLIDFGQMRASIRYQIVNQRTP